MNKDKLYKIIPQAKFYDSMGASWRPFSMYGQFSNIRSKYCNTDTNGFRFNKNTFPQKKISIFDCRNTAKKKGGVIIGNSTSFGEGLTGDDKTISNQLTLNTNYEFFNLSGRGYSGFQEIVNFIIHFHKIKNLKKIIVISGLNDSYLPFLINNYNEDLTPIFGYQKFMNGMLKETLGWKNKIFKFSIEIPSKMVFRGGGPNENFRNVETTNKQDFTQLKDYTTSMQGHIETTQLSKSKGNPVAPAVQNSIRHLL